MENLNFMKKALEIAKKGIGKVNPNPLVGAIIVKDNRIIGEGYHKFYGGNHAEVEAFESLKESCDGATLYVNLEPCSHYGKTPPCAKKIVEMGIKKVYISMIDPNPLVSGNGIRILKENNIEVEIGLLNDESLKLNEIFINYISKKTPFVVLKTAMTLDGKIASYTGDSKWISSTESREFVHNIRYDLSAIMVGVNTVIADNPRLDSRLSKNYKDPYKIIVDSNGRIPIDCKLVTECPNKVILATTKNINPEKKKALLDKNIKLLEIDELYGRVDLNKLMIRIAEYGIDSILLESGGELNYSCLEANIVNKGIFFIAPKIIGGRDSKTPIEGKGIEKMSNCINLHNMSYKIINNDIVVEGYFK